MLLIVKLKQTCHACPSQWEGKTDNGKDVYIRYRWGILRVDLNGSEIFCEDIAGDGLDGVLSTEELKTVLMGKVVFDL